MNELSRTKYIVVGFIIGSLISAPIVWAAASVTLRDGSGNAVGTATNPIVMQYQ